MKQPILSAIAIFLIFYGASVALDQILKRVSARFDTSTSEVFRLLSNSQKGLLIAIGLVLSLSELGFDVSALVAGLGLTGFALGLALKDAVSNLVAGVMIVLYKPIEIGDVIEISGTKGVVSNINLRYITLETDNNTNLVPNSLFLSHKLAIFKEAV
ncbi:MAG: mechanosensitive ion channel family protein [Nitrospiria bacterium]